MNSYTLSNEQLRLLKSTVRSSIIEFLLANGPASVNEIAPALDMSPKALYFHTRQLEAAGLLKVVETRMVVKRAESVYACVADYFHVDLSTSDPATHKAYADKVLSIIRNSQKYCTRAHQSLPPEHRLRAALRAQTASVKLTPAAIAKFEEKLVEWMRWIKEQGTPEDPTAARVSVSLVMTPVLDKTPTE